MTQVDAKTENFQDIFTFEVGTSETLFAYLRVTFS